MSNNDENISERQAEEQSFIEDRFIGLDNDNGLRSLDDVQKIIAGPAMPKLTPKIAKQPTEVKLEGEIEEKIKVEDSETQSEDELKLLNQKLKDMELAIAMLVKGRDNVQLKAAAIERKPIDFSKLRETDVFDLNIPIESIDHSMPDYMLVEPVDSNYVLRWVQKMPRRLGPMKAKGFVFAKKEDIKGELNLAIEENENGVFQFDDVILMKIEKRIYYGMLRKNHERALSMVNPKAAHQVARDRVISELRSAKPGEPGDKTSAGDFSRYSEGGKMSVYAPGMNIEV